MEKGTVFWITGLSGAGKTTVGKKLYECMRHQKSNVVLLDGDVLREVFASFDYSYEGRKNIAFQYSRLCKMLSDQGIDVIICTISMYDDVRKNNRDSIDKYIEIYLEVEMEELKKRDKKNLYTACKQSENNIVVGVTSQAELPKQPDILIKNYGEITPESAVDRIINYLRS